MPKVMKPLQDTAFLNAALEGLELQKSRIEEQIRQVRALLGGRSPKPAAAAPDKPAKRRRLSVAARKRIALAQRRRWAEYRKKVAAAKAS